MTRATTPLAVAADYADALMTARRAKNVLFLILILLILAELTFFLLARFDVIRLGPPALAAETPVATQPAAEAVPARAANDLGQIVRYFVPLIMFLGVALSVVLAIVMLLLVTIMLVGRLIGVSNVTGAFIWAVLLVVVLLPWQTFLIPDDVYPVTGATVTSTGAVAPVVEQPAFKWPGALYTYAELRRDHKFPNQPVWPNAVWMWGRYVGLPVLALILLLIVQAKSSRGLKYALGEADVQVEVTDRPDIGHV